MHMCLRPCAPPLSASPPSSLNLNPCGRGCKGDGWNLVVSVYLLYLSLLSERNKSHVGDAAWGLRVHPSSSSSPPHPSIPPSPPISQLPPASHKDSIEERECRVDVQSCRQARCKWTRDRPREIKLGQPVRCLSPRQMHRCWRTEDITISPVFNTFKCDWLQWTHVNSDIICRLSCLYCSGVGLVETRVKGHQGLQNLSRGCLTRLSFKIL